MASGCRVLCCVWFFKGQVFNFGMRAAQHGAPQAWSQFVRNSAFLSRSIPRANFSHFITLPLLAAIAGCNRETLRPRSGPSAPWSSSRSAGRAVRVIALPLSALFEKNGAPAVWVFNRPSGSVVLKRVTVARYEADTVVIGSGVATGDIVVTAGINMLRENQKVRLAAPARIR